MELDTSGFATQGPTVFAGNIGENKYIIQVSPMGIRLLEGGTRQKMGNFSHLYKKDVNQPQTDGFLFPFLPVTQLHFIPVDLGSPIVHCSVADPYVVIMTADGAVTMFVLKIDSYMGKTHRLALQKPQLPAVSKRLPSIGRHKRSTETDSSATAIACDHSVRLPRRERHVHHRKQSELLHHRGHHHQGAV